MKAALGLMAVAFVMADAAAQSYPSKPIRLIVPFASGGGGDGALRPLAPGMSAALGQQVVIDNRGGAGGIIGMEMAARSAPDGYTLAMASAGFTAMPGLYKSLPFDPVRDFTGIIVAESGSYLLVVNPAMAWKSVGDLIAAAKARPGQFAYASAGSGSSIHLAGELFKSMAGVDITHVPYKGAGPAIVDVVSGQVPLMFASALNALSLVNAGKLRALAVTTAKRSTLAPELPTVAESGLPGFEVAGWYGFVAPAKTPPAIVHKLNAAIHRALASPELVERLRALGLEPLGGSPAEADSLIRDEVARWSRVIRDARIPPQ
jgi:tripartite-type tricarboxylate transporter receptor subunit TctC